MTRADSEADAGDERRRAKAAESGHSRAKDYLAFRKKKLREQAAPREGRPAIFERVDIAFKGRTAERSAHELAVVVQQHGGDSHAPRSKHAARKPALTVAQNLNGSKTQRVLKAQGRITVVHPHYITDCKAANKLLAPADYLMIRHQGHTVPALFQAQKEGTALPPPVYKYIDPASRDSSSTSSNAKQQPKQQKRSATEVCSDEVDAGSETQQSEADLKREKRLKKARKVAAAMQSVEAAAATGTLKY